MSGTRLHKLTTFYLAAMYGVVGLTGQSLHYWAVDPTSVWASSPAAATVVYYHTHGPDYHGHFHRHTHDGDHSHAPHDATHQARRAERTPGVAPQQSIHESHACPLLTLVSTLKLGHGGLAAPQIAPALLVSGTFQSGVFLTLSVTLCSFARGPPQGSCA
jgi:hypothetical protein